MTSLSLLSHGYALFSSHWSSLTNSTSTLKVMKSHAFTSLWKAKPVTFCRVTKTWCTSDWAQECILGSLVSLVALLTLIISISIIGYHKKTNWNDNSRFSAWIRRNYSLYLFRIWTWWELSFLRHTWACLRKASATYVVTSESDTRLSATSISIKGSIGKDQNLTGSKGPPSSRSTNGWRMRHKKSKKWWILSQ